MSNYATPHVSQEVKSKVSKYEELDKAYKNALTELLDKNRAEVNHLNVLLEERNTLLQEVQQELRDEARKVPITVAKKIVCGPFSIQKKWSHSFDTVNFVTIAKRSGMYEKAIESGVIVEKTTINNKTAQDWINIHNLKEAFVLCQNGEELTPSISGPKGVNHIGEEIK